MSKSELKERVNNWAPNIGGNQIAEGRSIMRDQLNELDRLEAERDRLVEKSTWVSLLDHAKQGLENWARKPHNRKWWRKIDGTPIPNDLMIEVCKEISQALAAKKI